MEPGTGAAAVSGLSSPSSSSSSITPVAELAEDEVVGLVAETESDELASLRDTPERSPPRPLVLKSELKLRF